MAIPAMPRLSGCSAEADVFAALAQFFVLWQELQSKVFTKWLASALVVATSLQQVERGRSRVGRCPADSTVAGTTLRRGLNMVCRFSCRDNAIVAGRTRSYYSRMVNLDGRVPGAG